MKKRILWVGGSKLSEKRPVTPEDLRYVMGAETASGTGTTNDPTVKDHPPPPVP
jgi:hypothetical protein